MIRISAFSDEASKDLEGQIAALHDNRISMTEIRSINGVNVQDFSVADAKEYAKRLREACIGTSAIGSPLGKVDIHTDMALYEQKIRHVCELAQIFETDRIRVFSFFHAYDAREQVLDAMRRMVAIADEYGVTLYHENEKKIYGDTAERMIDLYQQVKGLRFVYDPANFLQVNESAEQTLQSVFPICSHFHMKDVDAETGELVPVGYGSGKVPELLRQLPEDAILTLEPHLAIFSGYAQIDGEEIKHRFRFESNRQAFDCAAQALHTELQRAGYVFGNGGYQKCNLA